MNLSICTRLTHRLSVAFVDETSLLEGRNRPIQCPFSTLNKRPPFLPRRVKGEGDKRLERLSSHRRYVKRLLLMRGRDAFQKGSPWLEVGRRRETQKLFRKERFRRLWGALEGWKVFHALGRYDVAVDLVNVPRAVFLGFHEEGGVPAGTGDVGVLDCELEAG